MPNTLPEKAASTWIHENIEADRVGLYGYDPTASVWRRVRVGNDGGFLISEGPSTLQKRFDPDSNNPDYIGFNEKGKDTTDTDWIINFYDRNDTGGILSIQSAIGSWDNRESLTYE